MQWGQCLKYFDTNVLIYASISASTLLASKINFFSNINDIIHLKFAENYCNRLITYDDDFEKLKPYSEIEIEILKW